jgi:defect in organelle trafficking protein DotC
MVSMKTKKLFITINAIVAIFLLAAGLSGCSSETPEALYRISSVKPVAAIGINNIRLTALKQVARSLGAQAGLAWRADQLDKIMLHQKHNLDQIFNFNYLVLNHNVLPPVLTEGDNTLNLADDETIRAADKEYKIVALPRFVTAPPSWRDYILLNYKRPEIPNSTLLPKSAREAQVWNEYSKIGWNEGIEQANEIFAVNLARLKRDYAGMLLYRKLLAQNMVSAPFVGQADLGVTGDKNDMRINDRVLRITSTSELKTNPKVWKPMVQEDRENQE